MNVQSSRIPSKARPGYTLFEVLLALGLSGLLMLLVYGAMQSFWHVSTAGRIDAERCQLARRLIREMEMDIRSVTFQQAKQQNTGFEEQAADEGAGNIANGSNTDANPRSMTTMFQEDESNSTANVHLMGGPQSLDMIVLRPTRNRTDILFEESESDRRRVGYMFSTGLTGIPGVYYRNVDQQQEHLMEQQGIGVDPLSQYRLLAPEVADLSFQYLDGGTNTWVEEWHSRDLGGLPRAIKITIIFHPAAMASTNLLRMSRTSGSTEVFQTVVHIPLSAVSLAL